MFLDVGISLLLRWICFTTQPPKKGLAHTVLLAQNSLLGFAAVIRVYGTILCNSLAWLLYYCLGLACFLYVPHVLACLIKKRGLKKEAFLVV
jgi:hypothetical protein